MKMSRIVKIASKMSKNSKERHYNLPEQLSNKREKVCFS